MPYFSLPWAVLRLYLQEFSLPFWSYNLKKSIESLYNTITCCSSLSFGKLFRKLGTVIFRKIGELIFRFCQFLNFHFWPPNLNYKQNLLTSPSFYSISSCLNKCKIVSWAVGTCHPCRPNSDLAHFQTLNCQRLLLALCDDAGFRLFYIKTHVLRKCPVKTIKAEC